VNAFYNRLCRYLLITLTVCFTVGVSVAFYIPSPPFSIHITALVAFLSLLCWWLRFNQATVILLCFCFLNIGWVYTSAKLSSSMSNDDVSLFIEDKEQAVIVGTLSSMISGSDQFKKLIVDSLYLKKQSSDRYITVSGKVLFTLDGDLAAPVLPGDSIIIRSKLRKPDSPGTPGVFDYSHYLASQNIYLTGFISSPLFIHKIDIDDRRATSSSHRVEIIRSNIATYINTVLPPQSSAIYKAILLGDKSAIDRATLDTFKKSGTLHILAISGMHMALLGVFSYTFLYWLLRRSERVMLATNVKKLSMLLCIPLLFFYTLLAGANVPVLRSFVMSLFVIFALCVNRVKSPLTVLAGAGLSLLIIDPLAVATVSFQLSFAAVASIILITPKLLLVLFGERCSTSEHFAVRTIKTWLQALFAITISAIIGTAPLLIYHFNHISLVAIVANFIIEPAICLWSLPLGFLGVGTFFIHPPLAELLFEAGIPGLTIASRTAQLLSELPFSSLWLPDISPVFILLYYSSLFLTIIRFSRITRFFGASLFVTVLVAFLIPLTPLAGSLRQLTTVSVIDVGQGSSNLIELAGGRNIIIDAGNLSRPDFDCGSEIVAPYLWFRGIGKIDDIILTHADADHYSGIPALIERFPIKRLWLPQASTDSPGFACLINTAEKKKIELVFIKKEISLTDGSAVLDFISATGKESPKPSTQGFDPASDNDSGIVVRLSTPHFSVLFPGDISSKKEQQLIKAGISLSANILLSPHHGSSTSNTLHFLSAVAPDYLVVSSGKSHPLSFPSEKTKSTAAMLNIPLLTTAEEGTITITSKKNGYRLESFYRNEKKAHQ